jgi:hypothetical protein
MEGDIMTYIVVRKGIFYDQGTVAVCDGLKEAKKAAEYFAAKEDDLYHDFEVRTQSSLKAFFSVVRWVLKSEDHDKDPRKWVKVA